MAYHEDAKIIDQEGLGAVYLSERLDVHRTTVCNWRTRGIPKSVKQTMSLLFPGKVPDEWRPAKASRKRK